MRPSFQSDIDTFIQSTKSCLYLLRLVDGQSPVIGKFYYCYALVDKHLRVLKQDSASGYAHDMHRIFLKRWKRWHRPIHTLAYALDPCYQVHRLTEEERADCKQVIKKIGGSNWTSRTNLVL